VARPGWIERPTTGVGDRRSATELRTRHDHTKTVSIDVNRSL
jgi:hypothetical protein